MWKKFIQLAVWAMTKGDVRKALFDQIRAMEAEKFPDGTVLSGPEKFQKVKAYALTLIKGTSSRFVDTLIHNMVLLIKG